MQMFGSYLIVENELKKVSHMFILSGAELERGNEAAVLYQQGYADTIVCVGGNVSETIQVLSLEFYESELTKLNLFRNGISDSVIKVIKKGTSTYQEAGIILIYCKQNNVKECIILSSKFHTRRMRNVFKKPFREEGINVIIRGAPAVLYSEEKWWANEYGLIALFNEYAKIFYYWFRY